MMSALCYYMRVVSPLYICDGVTGESLKGFVSAGVPMCGKISPHIFSIRVCCSYGCPFSLSAMVVILNRSKMMAFFQLT